VLGFNLRQAEIIALGMVAAGMVMSIILVRVFNTERK
jgi:hypothetical protein